MLFSAKHVVLPFVFQLTHFSPVLHFIQKPAICKANRMTCSYMKRNAGLKWVKTRLDCLANFIFEFGY